MKILIIDDNAAHSELALRKLEKEGWEVTTTDDPQPDPSFNEYNFILLDYHMPKANGIQILKQMKDLGIRTPVIFMTGHGNELIASEAIKLGAYDYVVKDTKLVYLDRIPVVIREAKTKHELIETNRFLIQELKRANDRLQRLTHTDEMTGLYNYRFLKKQLETEVKRTERYGNSLSICLIDIDYFKQINDKFGHPAGDAALRRVAEILLDTVRAVDFVGRYAGDEFLIIFPDTELKDAIQLCERIRKQVEQEKMRMGNEKVDLTLSVGVTDYHPKQRNNSLSIIETADNCLYRAKKMGRNRVSSAKGTAKSNSRPSPKEKSATI